MLRPIVKINENSLNVYIDCLSTYFYYLFGYRGIEQSYAVKGVYMEKKRLLMDQDAIMRAIRRISHEILERNKGLSNALIVGIERRGVILAKRLQAEIERIEGIHIDCESLNVAVYRDDRDARPKEGEPCTIDTTEKTIILVDDVLYTGRTIRAALNALMTAGRPRSIQLAVLVDRGHRELPIRADYVGKNIPTSHLESVRVAVADLDGEEGVTIQE